VWVGQRLKGMSIVQGEQKCRVVPAKKKNTQALRIRSILESHL
jgi:hypothetical protein